MRVLVVEDSVLTQEFSLLLRAAGFTVDYTDMGYEALEMVRRYDYDLILLDLMLPDIEGYEVVRRMRTARLATPVIVLSAMCRPQAKVKAFAVGADDFVTRPFDQAELVARMQAILRRSKGYSEPTLRVGPLQLNLDSRDVSVDGRPVHLTGKEYAILELLVLRKGTVLTKDAFLGHLYGGLDEPGTKIIDVFVSKLRRKLQLVDAGHLIVTVRGQGFMLRAEDERIPAATLDLPAAPAARGWTAGLTPCDCSEIRTSAAAP